MKIAWSDVWLGAAITALLFTLGKWVIGLYLGYASVGSTYGAAGSLLVLLVWAYYSAQILFFGAEFTQVYARRYGSQIRPSEHAVPLTEEAREQAGMPRKEAVERAAATGESVATASRSVAQPTATSEVNPVRSDGQMRHEDAAGGEHQQPGAVKRLLWAGSLAVAGLLARRRRTRS